MLASLEGILCGEQILKISELYLFWIDSYTLLNMTQKLICKKRLEGHIINTSKCIYCVRHWLGKRTSCTELYAIIWNMNWHFYFISLLSHIRRSKSLDVNQVYREGGWGRGLNLCSMSKQPWKRKILGHMQHSWMVYTHRMGEARRWWGWGDFPKQNRHDLMWCRIEASIRGIRSLYGDPGEPSTVWEGSDCQRLRDGLVGFDVTNMHTHFHAFIT